MVLAIRSGYELLQQDLFSYERPIAQQTAIIANQNRDPKQQKKAFSFEDFSFYMPRDARNLPSGSYGAAAVMLLKENRFPSWALFCYKDLVASARPSYEPELPALVAEDCILLHPVKVAGGWKGMMIATESASDKRRVFSDGKGGSFVLNVPYVGTKFVAEEDVIMQQ